MDSSVKHTEIKLEESHFSASSDSELLVAGRCNLSITESNIQQGKYSQWATSDFTDTHSTDNKYCSLASGLSKDDVRVQEKPKWELEELRVATGKIDCTVMRHNLNLCSVYSEVPVYLCIWISFLDCLHVILFDILSFCYDRSII